MNSEPIRQEARVRNYRVHIRKRAYGNKNPLEPLPQIHHPARRWVVERTLSWQNDFRSLRVRWAKKSENWLALIHMACVIVLWQMCSNG